MIHQFDSYIIIKPERLDAYLFYEMVDQNRSRLEDYFSGTVCYTTNLDSTREYCDLLAEKAINKIYFPYVIVDAISEKYIGYVDLKNIDWSIPKTEVGYFIDERYEGKGIITKAVGVVIEHITSIYKFKKILCRANEDNKGSIQVALNNGFELEGVVRRDYKKTNGEIVDLNYYGRLF